MSVRRFRQTVILGVAVSALAAVPWAARADDAPASAKSAQKEKTVQVLVAQGNAALAAKSYATAHDSFSDALTLDHRNADAIVGDALARMELGQNASAVETIDEVAGAGVPTRSVAINAAVIHMTDKDPTRAAKILKTYLSAPATPHDEHAYDLFITALSQFSAQAKENFFYNSCQTFAASYAAKLAQDHPDQKLWGIDWLPADQVDRKAEDLKSSQKTIDADNAKVAAIDRQVNVAQAKYNTLENLYEKGEASRYVVRNAQNQVDQLQRQEKSAQDAADNATARVDQPPLLESVDPLMPGDSDQVASATPMPADTGGSDSGSTPPAVPPASQHPQQADAPPTAPPVHVDPPKKVAVTNYAVAFAVAPNLAITDARAVHDGNSFSLQCPDGTVVQATLVRTDSAGKLALLQLSKSVAYLDLAPSFAGGRVTCTGFPDVDIFNPTPAAITGVTPAPTDDWEIKLNKQPRLGGAPLTDSGGKLVGVELAARDSDPAAIPAASLDAVHTFLGSDQPQAGHGTNKPDTAIFQLVSTSEP
jgi:hypothetical protein